MNTEYVWVPRDPTKAMILAAELAVDNHKDSTWDSGGDGNSHNSYEYFTAGVEKSVWDAMLAAAPALPAVDEAMVERACVAAQRHASPTEVWPDDYKDADDLRSLMRAALTAALSGPTAQEEGK